MPETYQHQTALAHLHLGARAVADAGLADAGVQLTELPGRALINVRGDISDAAFKVALKKAVGAEPPATAGTVSGRASGPGILWLGPNEWLVSGEPGSEQAMVETLGKALAGQFAAVTDVSEGRAVIRLEGKNARDVLSKGCPLDLHPKALGPGNCAQTILGRSDMLLHCFSAGRGKAEAFHVYVGRSFAEYAWTWLEDAGREYGVQVIGG
jgi:sarcosine oxidase subunit gamma